MTPNLKKLAIVAVLLTMTLTILFAGAGLAEGTLTPIEELGEFLYFDEKLSQPTGQSCASCHDPGFGFVDPDWQLPVSEGVLPNHFGTRNSPASAYAMYAPIFYFDEGEGLWIGGQFWDGRATGWELGDPLADQALGPFTNPVEMANPDRRTVIRDVASSSYKGLYEEIWPSTDLDNWNKMTTEEVNAAYEQVALSIAAFERTALFAQFSSKYDAYLEDCLELGGDPADCAVGKGPKAKKAGAIFTDQEWYGMQLFMGDKNNNDGMLRPNEGAACVLCHVADWTAAVDYDLPVIVPDWAPEGMVPPVFTDFTFDNLGVPKSDEYPLADAPIDYGLGPIVQDPAENGKFKVMTLRNIGLTPPYAHNGLFKSLKDITNFYNTRDIPGMWDAPEVPETVNFDELGNLGLSGADEDALVAFMMTLSDGYVND
jgi:cytochrome c peroxidase